MKLTPNLTDSSGRFQKHYWYYEGSRNPYRPKPLIIPKPSKRKAKAYTTKHQIS